MTTKKRGAYLKGKARQNLAKRAAGLYLAGCTIRSTAAQIDRSYGNTRQLLLDAKVKLRAPGGRLPKAGA